MNEYLFYKAVENSKIPNKECFVLGKAFGNNVAEARENFLKENLWIMEEKYKPSDFIAKQILTDEQIADIKKIVEYLWADEKKHYEELLGIDLDEATHTERIRTDEDHIFSSLKRLRNSLGE